MFFIKLKHKLRCLFKTPDGLAPFGYDCVVKIFQPVKKSKSNVKFHNRSWKIFVFFQNLVDCSFNRIQIPIQVFAVKFHKNVLVVFYIQHLLVHLTDRLANHEISNQSRSLHSWIERRAVELEPFDGVFQLCIHIHIPCTASSSVNAAIVTVSEF